MIQLLQIDKKTYHDTASTDHDTASTDRQKNIMIQLLQIDKKAS